MFVQFHKNGIVLLLLLILLLILRSGRKKNKDADADLDGMFDLAENAENESAAGEPQGAADGASAGVAAQDEEMRRNEEIINLRMQHSMKLKQNIGDFVDQNPQIAAKLVQGWLRGEVEDVGRKGSDAARKEK